MNLRDGYNLFMKDQLLKGNSDKTLRYYRTHLKLFFDFIPDTTLISNFTLNDLNNYKIYLLDTDLVRPTVRTYIRAVRSFVNFLADKGYAEKNLKEFKLPKPDKRLFNILTLEQIKQVNDTFNYDTPCGFRNKCIFNLFLDSGIRRDELINLNINRLYDNYFIVIGKGNKERIVTYGDSISKLIKQYISDYRPFDYKDIEILFLNRNGSPITEDTIKRMFQDLRMKTGIKTLYPHQLRHTFATYFLVNGGDSFTLQMLLGHTSIEMTEQYVHLANIIKITMLPNNTSLVDSLNK